VEEPKFQRRIENFICEHCGAEVKGDGFTNHCPVCLWSKHVDIQPGDRAESCQGLMEPIAVQPHKDSYRIKFRCEHCGAERWNKSSPQDDFDVLLEIARKQAGPGG
jgi:hypothetical protein